MRPFGYDRVSSRDQVEGYSLDQQQAAIRAYCQAQGWQAPTFFTDAGRSGYTDVTEKRPAFAAMLREAEAGGCDVVIVHRLDRFARSLTVTLRELKRLQSSNVAFVSIGENMDFSTPIGRVLLAMLGALAEYFSANLAREVRKGLAGRRAAGFRHATLPFGARLVGGTGPAIEVDPAREDALCSLLTLVAGGSYALAVHALNGDGIPARRGGLWQNSSVRAVVVAASWLLEQPEPWPSRYIGAARRVAASAARAGKQVRMLTGLARCADCRGGLGYQPREPLPVALRCHKSCPGGPPYVASLSEAQVAAWVAALPDADTLVRAALRLAAGGDDRLGELTAVREARRLLRLHHEAHLIDDATMLAEAAILDARERGVPGATQRTAAYWREIVALRDDFPTLSPPAQNAVLRQLVKVISLGRTTCAIEPLPELGAVLASVQVGD